MKEYGVVIGQSDPQGFDFNIVDKGYRPVAYEYVQVTVEEPQPDGSLKPIEVLGQVKQISSSHPFYDERTTPGAAWKQRELGVADELIQVIAHAKILGYIAEDGEVRRPRSPPMPGTAVYRADDALLQRLFSLPEEEIPLDVGSLLHRTGIKVPISGRELHRHTAILAMTRYGKSYFAGRIIEQLVRQGASVLIIDAHGDYANMCDAPGGGGHPEFRDRVRVLRPEGAEGFEAPHVRPLTLSISGCSIPEICALAQIRGSLQVIALRKAIRSLSSSKGKNYTIDDIIDALMEDLPEKAEGRERINRVIERLEDLKNRGIFTEQDLNIQSFFDPMQVTDIFLSGLSDGIQDVVVGMLLNRVFDAKFRRTPWAVQPLFVFVEEAHRFAAPPEEGGGRFSREVLAKIAAEGAKFGVFLTVISQRPRRIDPDILSNCSNLAILRVVNSQDQHTIEAASESFSADLLGDLPALEQGEAVLVGPFVPVPVMIKTAKRETRHGGRTPDIYRLLRDGRERARAAEEKRSRPLY